MKIALVTRRYPPLIGGAEVVLSYLAAALAAEGAGVVVVTSEPIEDAGPPPSSPVPVVRLPTRRARFVGTVEYLANLRGWFGRNRVDVAYVSMMKHDAFVAVGAGRRLGFPVVLRPEGAGATGDVAWQGWGRFGGAIARRCRRADAVVAISPAVRREVVGAGYDPARVVDLPNGVPVPDRPWADPGGPPTALYVGRLAPEKGLDTLLDAWSIVADRRPDARLTIVGEGPERPGLEGQRGRLGLDGSVAMPGAMADPSAIRRASGLFVLPSREEGMSIALLEAMAMGLPAVASAIPGNLGLVDDGVHGRLAPPDDPPALAAAILDRWADPAAAAVMASAARRRVVDRFSIAAVARAHLALFDGLIRRR